MSDITSSIVGLQSSVASAAVPAPLETQHLETAPQFCGLKFLGHSSDSRSDLQCSAQAFDELGGRQHATVAGPLRAAWSRPKQTDLVPGKGQFR